jgi:hypothetical protein
VKEERKSLYVESTIPSYATARPSADVVIAGRQILTRQFWEAERHKYDLYVGQPVVDECGKGDPSAARRRLYLLQGIRMLPKTAEITALAAVYQKLLEIPNRAKADCIHLATCVINEIDYLLTWNCTHMGAASQAKMQKYNEKHNIWSPLLVTPEDLLIYEEENL